MLFEIVGACQSCHRIDRLEAKLRKQLGKWGVSAEIRTERNMRRLADLDTDCATLLLDGRVILSGPVPSGSVLRTKLLSEGVK